MSIATEITRLQNAKAAIMTAITNKGVSVASTKKIDELAALINAILTIPSPITKIVAGSFSPTSNLMSKTITHNFGTFPIGAACWCVTNTNRTDTIYAIVQVKYGDYLAGKYSVYTRELRSASQNKVTDINNNTSVNFYATTLNDTGPYFDLNFTYNYMIWG